LVRRRARLRVSSSYWLERLTETLKSTTISGSVIDGHNDPPVAQPVMKSIAWLDEDAELAENFASLLSAAKQVSAGGSENSPR